MGRRVHVHIGMAYRPHNLYCVRVSQFKLTYFYQILNGSFVFPNAPLERRNVPVKILSSY